MAISGACDRRHQIDRLAYRSSASIASCGDFIGEARSVRQLLNLVKNLGALLVAVQPVFVLVFSLLGWLISLPEPGAWTAADSLFAIAWFVFALFAAWHGALPFQGTTMSGNDRSDGRELVALGVVAAQFGAYAATLFVDTVRYDINRHIYLTAAVAFGGVALRAVVLLCMASRGGRQRDVAGSVAG